VVALDRKAVEILIRAYWSGAGWRDPPVIEPEDFEYARTAGVMFDGPVSKTHNEVVFDVVATVRTLDPKLVADAFLLSLTTRRLELRSALGSYAVARLLPEHDHVPWLADRGEGKTRCAICGLWDVEVDVDYNVLSFERYKWGGVRRDDLTYVQFDLDQFVEPDEQPTDEDRSLFRQLLAALDSQPPDVTAPRAQAALKVLPSNKDERGIFLDIMGVCGVLETPEHRGYAQQFIRAAQRELPPLRFVERSYPVCWWRGSNGVNRDALATFRLPS
jgi:hypothetical protein